MSDIDWSKAPEGAVTLGYKEEYGNARWLNASGEAWLGSHWALVSKNFLVIATRPTEPTQDPRICIDVSNFDEDKKKRVIDAFYEMGHQWVFGNKYSHLDAVTYTNSFKSGELKGQLMYGNLEPREAERQYEHTYDQLMQRAYGYAGYPDERKTVYDAVAHYKGVWGVEGLNRCFYSTSQRLYFYHNDYAHKKDEYLVCTREEFEACVEAKKYKLRLGCTVTWGHANVPIAFIDKDGFEYELDDYSHDKAVYSKAKPTITKAQAEERLGMTITD